MIWFVFSLLGLTITALAVTLMRIDQMKREATAKTDHDACLAGIKDVTGKRFLAEHLRHLAAKYDSMEERTTFAELARNNFTSEGASMPALWLNLQAELLDPTEFNYNEVAIAEYTMEGKRVL